MMQPVSATTTEANKGERTRTAILESAVELASAEGLEGLTIGRLATELRMSKSGLFAHSAPSRSCSWRRSPPPASASGPR